MRIAQYKSYFLLSFLIAANGVPHIYAIGSRGFFAAQPVVGATVEMAKKIIVADLNNDEKPDFLTMHWEIDDNCKVQGLPCGRGFIVKKYLNITPKGARDPVFQSTPYLFKYYDDYRRSPVWNNDLLAEDVNGDGVVDIVVANAHRDIILVYLGIKDQNSGKGTGTYSDPVITQVADDPSYIVTGNFLSSTGLKQLYIEHYDRDEILSDYYSIHQSIYQFNADGTLDNKNYRHSWNGIFTCGVEHVYYGPGSDNHFTAALLTTSDISQPSNIFFKVPTIQGLVPTTQDLIVQNYTIYRGAYYINDRGLFDDHIRYPHPGSIQDAITGECDRPYAPGEFYTNNYHVFDSGNVISQLDTRTQRWNKLEYDKSLDDFFSGKLLDNSEKQRGIFGAAALSADFDGDNLPDLMLLSGEVLAKDDKTSDQAILVAYSNTPDRHPLDTDLSVGFDTENFKILSNASGRGNRGHRNWRWAVGDFNGDGFPDLIDITDSGVMVHTNFGNFATEAVQPVLNDMAPRNAKPGQVITVFGNFHTGDQLANWIEVSDYSMGPQPVKYLWAVDPLSVVAPFNKMIFTIPVGKIKPGDYKVRVTNTIARSSLSLTLTVQ